MNTKRVLIIDDDEEIASLTKLALNNSSFSVDVCFNHKEVEDFFSSGKLVDVILLDYFLPEVDGLEIAKRLFEKGITIPIIFFTASDEEHIKDSYPANIVDTLKKPFSIDNLIESLNRVVRIKNLLKRDNGKNAINSSQILNIHEEVKHIPHLQDIIFTEKAISLKSMLSKLSHTIKNALQTIMNYMELLEKGYVDETEKVHIYNTIRKKIDYIKDTLHILKKPEYSYMEENFSVKMSIKKVLDNLHKELKTKDIYVKTNFQKQLPLYFGNRLLFMFFFQSLFSKILECIEKGGQLIIDAFLHQQEYYIEIQIVKVLPLCENYLHFFDLSHKDHEGYDLTGAIMALKDIGGKVRIEQIESDKLIFQIKIPMRSQNV